MQFQTQIRLQTKLQWVPVYGIVNLWNRIFRKKINPLEILVLRKIYLISLWYRPQNINLSNICYQKSPIRLFPVFADFVSFCFITDLCMGLPCENGGTCIENADDYTCTCVPGFTGRNCQTSNEASLSKQPILCKGPVSQDLHGYCLTQ